MAIEAGVELNEDFSYPMQEMKNNVILTRSGGRIRLQALWIDIYISQDRDQMHFIAQALPRILQFTSETA